jgi:FkbM family methyltransferase
MSASGSSVRQHLLDVCGAIGGIRCVYDCGSRDALDGLELATRIGASELHVFECNPAGVEKCRASVAAYRGPARVLVNDVAIADFEGETEFNSIDPARTVTPHADGNIGASSLFAPRRDYPNETYVTNRIRVRTTTLDRYAESHSPPDLLWMDLQGAELMALRGAARVLERVRAIYVEVTFRPMYEGQPLFHEVHRHLKDRFRLHTLYDLNWRQRMERISLGKRVAARGRGAWFTDALYVNRNLRA